MPNNQTYPLSFMEQRMLDLNKQIPDADILNRPVKVLGNICASTFLGSYKWLAEKYSILKTRYVKDEQTDTFVKVLDHPAAITYEDYSHKSDEALDQRLLEITRGVFDLEKDPLFKMFLIRSNENESIFFIKCHHINADGMSCLRLFQSVFEAYCHHRITGSYPPLNPEYGIPSFIECEEAYRKSKQGVESKKYWTDLLDNQRTDSTVKNIPKSIESHSVDLMINRQEYESLSSSVHHMEASMFSYTAATFQKNLASDMLVSTTITNRIQKAHRMSIGAMFKYALLGQGPLDESFDAKVTRLKKEIFKAQRNPYCCDNIGLHGNPNNPFDYKKTALVTYFRIDPNGNGVSSLAFGSGSSDSTPISPELSVKPLDLPIRFVPYSLFLSIGDFKTNLHLKLIYNIELYSKQEANIILQNLKSKLLNPETSKMQLVH